MILEDKEIAYQKRKSFESKNNFTLRELLSFPSFYGFVDCYVDKNDSFSMFLGGRDDAVALRFFWNGSYEQTTLKTWFDLSRNAKGAIIDIGAHTGSYSCAALLANNHSDVISFEPHFMNFSRLLLNIRANNFKNSKCFMLCVGKDNKYVPFSISTDINYLSTGGSVGLRNNSISSTVQQVSLDSFIPDEIISNISLIKMDVEGYEPNCFLGMHKILKNYPTIFFECINTESGQKVQEILSSYGYNFYEIDDLTGKITKVKNLEPQFDKDNKLVMHKLNRIAIINETF